MHLLDAQHRFRVRRQRIASTARLARCQHHRRGRRHTATLAQPGRGNRERLNPYLPIKLVRITRPSGSASGAIFCA
jgi:hypothetical protein